jgi:hypothetical protein
VAEASDWVKEWHERIAADYQAAVERGEHDEKCEYDVRGFYLCHCSKRRREAAGHTELPTHDLYFPPPDCPRCHKDLSHDEGWYCNGCSLSWDSTGYGDSARFTEVHGDDLAADAEQWRSKQPALAANPSSTTGDEQ